MVCLEVRQVSKSFPGVQALDRVDLEVCAGECHALVGENGAGKSTLMKILSGALLPDSGEILLSGKHAEIRSPADARHRGISMIYQELNLLPELSVAENIFLGREPRRAFGFLKRREMIEESRRWLGRLNQNIDPACPAKTLPLAGRQMVEIVKALSLQAKVMILDEPSSILTDRELDQLFALMSRLKADGLALIYISHRLEEIFRVCDRVTVMRDGRTVSTRPVREATHAVLVREMVGRELARIFPPRQPAREEIVLRIEGLHREGVLTDVSIEARRGEIVGIAGLVGAGRTELARCIFGADPVDAGAMYLEGRPLSRHNPHEAVARGVGLLTEDRKAQGLLLNMTVRENVTLASLAQVSRAGWIRAGREIGEVAPILERLRVKTPSIDHPVANLSGGNQQKTLVARWLFSRSRLLIFDEPTRGVDVGAKSEIYQLIADLASQGKTILVISSELPEVLGLCHRIYVMRLGRVAGEFPAETATQERLLAAAMGVSIPG